MSRRRRGQSRAGTPEAAGYGPSAGGGGCREVGLFTDHKWDYINLADFKAKGCGPGFVYGYLWFSLVLSIAVYGVDSFTAVNLLAFDRWSSKIEPAIPIDVSKWIFSGCIIASFVNLAYEGIRAFRVMRRRNVAECYMDSLAARWESIRLGKGQGWKRFLVFAELTKSKKGAEYIALFTYFSFQCKCLFAPHRFAEEADENSVDSLCSGPRQVVNALTLRSVYVAKLNPGKDSVEGSIVGFFDKIKQLAEEDYQQAVILSGMCFTLVIWVFSALYLLSAILFYVFFLFHWIPRDDGGLTGYCERKVNKRLTSIVTTKVNKALAKSQAKREKADALAMRNGEKPHLERAATLPVLPDVGPGKEDSLPQMPMLGRNETTTTLPAYTSRPGTPNSFELTAMDQKRPLPSRSGTSGSYSSRAPLIGGAADMGYGRASPEPRLPDLDFGPVAPLRTATANSQRYRPYGPGTGSIRNFTATPAPMDGYGPPTDGFAAPGGGFGPTRTPTAHSMNAYGDPPARYDAYNPGRQDTYDGRASPAPTYRTGTPAARPPMGPGPGPGPMRSLTGQVPPRSAPPQRNMTAPVRPGDFEPPARTGTSQSARPPGQGTPWQGYENEYRF
ncbi:LOW QUALITY PROTEIN: pheromone-regulated membrane protein [Purpureocillium lavendulum]|uniref:Pheromone-regulated membrane protein n=1 Tax=Purpureocillium lavendulum TaxID=1247861 RepID=A0AB34FFY0_9HYPO|nr:LOW QUALITY PROTEIN: pheromone-regulated membrane protein [Purpureocillium lavendulum]